MADYAYIDATGIILPDTGEILADVQSEWREALGADLDVSPETPQGVLIAAEAEARDATVRALAEVANQNLNPDVAAGVWLDAIWKLTGGARVAATYSRANGVVVTGTPNTIVPAGARVATGDGDVFASTGAIIIGATGVGAGSFQAEETGPVVALVGSLTNILTPVLGWETVTNPTAAALGRAEETDMAARRRRRQTLALQGASTSEAVQSRLAAVPGYRSHVFRENVTNALLVIDGATLWPHSIYVVVDGGADTDVAAALLDAKSSGSGWNGATVVSTTDAASGQTYAVQFDRPDTIDAFVRVTARFNGTDGQALIPAAINEWANGLMEGESGLTVGAPLSPFELAGAINRKEPRILVTAVEISTDGLTFAPTTLVATIQQIVAVANITVVEI